MSASYIMSGVENLGSVPNVGAVIERIDHAATRACILYRATGQKFSQHNDQQDFDIELRRLVSQAAEECFEKQAAGRDMMVSKPVIIEVEGVAESDHFQVYVECDSNGHLTVDIYVKLV